MNSLRWLRRVSTVDSSPTIADWSLTWYDFVIILLHQLGATGAHSYRRKGFSESDLLKPFD
jgi:hypothetical protein